MVQLRCATLPGLLRPLAVHCWFVSRDRLDADWHRWEVWCEAGAGGTNWGHVHLDLQDPDEGVGGGPFSILREWRGDDARALIGALESSKGYPDRDRYVAWPGPNSNTYVAWVLRRAAIRFDLPPQAIGKDWIGPLAADLSTSRTGAQFETPIVGVKVGLLDGIEVHPLCFTLGVDLVPPAIKTPFGRIGVRE